MANANQASTTKGSALSSMRKTALVAGVLYLLTFLSSIPAVFLQSSVLNDPSFIISSVSAEPVRIGALFDIVNSLTAFGTAVGGAMNDEIALMFAGKASPQDIVDATQAAADAEK